ncbi:hypothetical protein PAEPH01_1570 [Pancytospora epiphaga]|nr:hypothetical protein PAEPH01_1570 [Pancytospora epiphaga]
MKEKCLNACTRAIITLEKTSILLTIEDFLGNLEISTLKNDIILAFYDYIGKKYQITCEAGMLFVERVLTLHTFNTMYHEEDTRNTLINAKVALYSWLKPVHLKLEVEIPENIVKAFKRLTLSTVPTVKLNAFMHAIEGLYEIIGRKCGHDTLFSALVYCLIKSQISDLMLHFKYMKLFYRPHYGRCDVICFHGFTISVRCTCLCREDWKGEEEYYLVVALAALEYIQKIEYYNLTVSVTEFNMEISERLKSIKLGDDKNTH